jgi:hypothetical protein
MISTPSPLSGLRQRNRDAIAAWLAQQQGVRCLTDAVLLPNVEARIPADHPLRTIKAVADQALAKLSKVISNSYQLWVLEWIMPTMRAGAKPSTGAH